jgi:ribosomal-protein-alanine N-acetyltransferase
MKSSQTHEASTIRHPLPYRIEPMRVADLHQVMEIEKVAHVAPWPSSAYEHELEHNDLSHYYVLVPESANIPPPAGIAGRLLAWLRRPRRGRPIFGYGGFWMIAGEAHISTIAVDPEWQGMGLGELLLLSLIRAAIAMEATIVTLEVRVSNVTAQNLYRKYHFEYVGKRKRYYRDNHEDAHIMTVEDAQSDDYRALLAERWARLQERLSRAAEGSPPYSHTR